MAGKDHFSSGWRSAMLLGVCLWAGVSVTAAAEGGHRDTTASRPRTLVCSPHIPARDFIALGESVAEQDIALFTADLLQTYKVLEGDQRNLTRLFERCGRSWGATAYALVLQASSKRPLREVVMYYDLAGWDWQQAARHLDLLLPWSGTPVYTLGLYLIRQQEQWERILEAPLRWRRTFLDR